MCSSDLPRLKGVLPKDYARPGLDKQRLGELIDVIATIELTAASEGEKTHRSVDLLGRVYEYFLTRFASAEGKNGGQFYTPSCVVRCLVDMLAPYKGRIYDPACGSGGMFVQSEKFVESHGGRRGDISIYGQESNATTRRLAVMNLALRGIEADFGAEHADTFRRDLHPDLRADYVIANRRSMTVIGSGKTTMCAGSMGCRQRGTRTSRGCSTSFTIWRRTGMRGSCWRMGVCRRISRVKGRFVAR